MNPYEAFIGAIGERAIDKAPFSQRQAMLEAANRQMTAMAAGSYCGTGSVAVHTGDCTIGGGLTVRGTTSAIGTGWSGDTANGINWKESLLSRHEYDALHGGDFNHIGRNSFCPQPTTQSNSRNQLLLLCR